MMLATNAGTFLKAARSVSISSGICCVAIPRMVIANPNAASMKVASGAIAMRANRTRFRVRARSFDSGYDRKYHLLGKLTASPTETRSILDKFYRLDHNRA